MAEITGAMPPRDGASGRGLLARLAGLPSSLARKPPGLSLTAEQIAFYHHNGFLAVPQITTPDEIAWMIEVYDRLFAQRAGWESGDLFDFGGTDEPGKAVSVPQLLMPSKYAPELIRSLYRNNAQHMSRQLLGPSAKLIFDHAMMKPARTGGETTWHQDQAFYPAGNKHESLTVWMALQPTNSENGCLEFIPGSNRGPLLEHRTIGNDPRVHGIEALGVDDGLAVQCPLPAGGASFHHCRTLHHAGPNRSDGPRRAFALGFGVLNPEMELSEEYPWNAAKQTARQQRADASRSLVKRVRNSLRTRLGGY